MTTFSSTDGSNMKGHLTTTKGRKMFIFWLKVTTIIITYAVIMVVAFSQPWVLSADTLTFIDNDWWVLAAKWIAIVSWACALLVVAMAIVLGGFVAIGKVADTSVGTKIGDFFEDVGYVISWPARAASEGVSNWINKGE